MNALRCSQTSTAFSDKFYSFQVCNTESGRCFYNKEAMSELLSESFHEVIKLQKEIESFTGIETEELVTRRQLIQVNIPSLLQRPPFF